MMVQLADAVDDLEKWERGVALILHGTGGNFCAGADLSLAREHLVTGADGRSMCALMTDTLTRLRRCVCCMYVCRQPARQTVRARAPRVA